MQDTLAGRKRKELALIDDLLPVPGQVAYCASSIRAVSVMRSGAPAIWRRASRWPCLLADDMVMAETPCLKQMVDVYGSVGGNLVAVMDVPREQTERYGVLKTGRVDGRLTEVKGLVEKPTPADAPSTLSIIGRYILQPQVFDLLAEQKPGAGGEVQLTDALAGMIGHGPFNGYRFEGTRFDCGDKAGFIEATIAYALKHDVIGGAVRDIVRDFARRS